MIPQPGAGERETPESPERCFIDPDTHTPLQTLRMRTFCPFLGPAKIEKHQLGVPRLICI